jgi:hypothetical protein
VVVVGTVVVVVGSVVVLLTPQTESWPTLHGVWRNSPGPVQALQAAHWRSAVSSAL